MDRLTDLCDDHVLLENVSAVDAHGVATRRVALKAAAPTVVARGHGT